MQIKECEELFESQVLARDTVYDGLELNIFHIFVVAFLLLYVT